MYVNVLQAAHLCLQQSPSNSELCRTYIHTLRSVAEKNVLRLCAISIFYTISINIKIQNN